MFNIKLKKDGLRLYQPEINHVPQGLTKINAIADILTEEVEACLQIVTDLPRKAVKYKIIQTRSGKFAFSSTLLPLGPPFAETLSYTV